MILRRLILVFLGGILLPGCTSLGSHILSNPNNYLSEAELIDASPTDLGFENRKFCDLNGEKCIPYLFASAYSAEKFSKDQTVYYNLHTQSGDVESSISHRMTPDTFGRAKGTAILLHGYGGSKEAMMVTAFYFRALGMKTILPDLFGHGASDEEFKFATKEHKSFSALINNLKSNQQIEAPIIVVGHSMGALAAINLLQESQDVQGAILLAPMLRFDKASEKYLPYKLPTISQFISQRMLNDIVESAMNDAGVTLSDTDIIHKIKNSKKPLLVVTSDKDSVSPSNYFSSLSGDNVQLIEFNGRNHPSLIAFSTEDTKVIESWLYEMIFLQQ
ncbi:alpha/beta hydrolase [Aliikangiella coralliicola]|uniref:alpha/beta hydrolase n=1 Tax=Aliikangiella coralliicola TaxID=2592383 RepID=UPI001AEF6CF5|nr:alpha/beta fold hydrolase [Aliikangiella coralliicola]